ncbi:MAG: MBL fold metallo-hydrolase [Methanobacterium sp. BRmetb2]|nr:MAG: MBL fold metallo-hydrolase [Methanobacterium sp. BRmetb2]
MDKINDILIIEGTGFDSNIYVFDDVMVDTGTGDNIEYILNSLKKADMSLDDISMIVNTHCHYDHAGGDHCISKKIAIHQEDAAALENGDDIATVSYMFGRSFEPVNVDFRLKEGDKIHDFQVIHTPGHTSGGICLYDGETLISGDTVFAGGGFGRLDIGGSVEDMKNSIEKLNKLEIEYLLPGHGPWVKNGSKHVEMVSQFFKGI